MLDGGNHSKKIWSKMDGMDWKLLRQGDCLQKRVKTEWSIIFPIIYYGGIWPKCDHRESKRGQMDKRILAIRKTYITDLQYVDGTVIFGQANIKEAII